MSTLPAQLTCPCSSLLQVGGVNALRAHPPVLGRDHQVSDLRQNLHRRVCLLSAAAAVQESAGEHHPPSSEEEPVPAVRLQHQQHARHHGRQLRRQKYLSPASTPAERSEVSRCNAVEESAAKVAVLCHGVQRGFSAEAPAFLGGRLEGRFREAAPD